MGDETSATWPAGGGDMAARIRAFDWRKTPLGPIGTWPISLCAAVDLTLGSPVATVLLWGPAHTQIYNDHWRILMGDKHPAALGQPTHACFPEIAATMAPLYGRVQRGEAVILQDMLLSISRHGAVQEAWWNVHYLPVRDEGAAVAGILCTVMETTRSVLAERERAEAIAALRASGVRQTFLLKLSDALRPLTDAIEIENAAMKLLAEQLDVMRATYSEVDDDQDGFTLTARHERNPIPIPEHMRLSDFAPDLADAYRAGNTLVFRDTEIDAQLESQREAYRAIGIRAWVAVPLVKDNRLIAIVAVHSTTPRAWTGAEVQLLEDVAERSWAAVERARAEAALRASEAKYRGLFESIDTGYCVIEVIFDAAATPVDYVFLEANPAFTRQTGLVDAIGKPVRSLIPNHEEFWFETYGRIARTGQPERFEHRADAIDRWYTVYAFRVGAPEEHRVAVLFEDIKDRKIRELHTEFLDRMGKDLDRLSDPDEIMQVAGARVGAFLQLSGCLFCDVDEAANEVTMHHGWTSDQVPGLKQTFRLDDYLTEAFARAGRAGENFVVRDTSKDARVDAGRHARLKIGAFVTIPFFSQGRWTAFFSANAMLPRDWRQDEIELLREISERLFARVQRARAEAALRESEEQQRLTIQLVPAMLWWADPVGHHISPNAQWTAYTGQREAEAQDFGWLDAIHPDDVEETRAAFEHAFATGEPLERQQRIGNAKDGYRWHLVRHVPLRDGNGAITRWFGAAIDVHDLRQLQERQRLLVAELQHRTRNLMTVVSALSQRTVEEASSLDDFGQRFRHRLAALARVQGLLSQLSAGERVTFDELLGSELAALGAPDDKLKLDGPGGVEIRAAAMQTFALALHELATNALKYGAFAAADGHLTVRWSITLSGDGTPRLQVDWRESGVVMSQVKGRPQGGGYGRELIEQALPYQLDANTTYALTADGVHCTIDVPTASLRGGSE